MRYLSYILVFLSLVACQEVNRPEKPDDLIPQETMIEILKEAYIDNAARSLGNKVLREKGIRLDSLIYARYGIDSLQFVKSHAYYASEINDYIAMMETVEKELALQKDELDTLIAQERKEQEAARDSLKKDLKSATNDSLKIATDTIPTTLVDPVEN